MFFYLLNKKRTVKELRKNSGYTVKELALKVKCDTVDISKIDMLKLKDVSDDMKEKLIPVFRGDRYHNVPW